MSEPMILVHLDDLSIVRDTKWAKLYDCDGEYLGSLPADWTNDQIHRAVMFANGVYDRAYYHGRATQMTDLRHTFTRLFGGILKDS